MLDRLTSMAAFVKAADLGSFTAAGTALGLSSQMVGKHIVALEDRLGTPLLRRSTRRQSLTETGRLYYERCRSVLAEAEAADALIEDMSAAPLGLLRVSAPVAFGACRLAPAITEFIRSHTGVSVELTLSDRYVDMIDEGYDVVLRLAPSRATCSWALSSRPTATSTSSITAFRAPCLEWRWIWIRGGP